MGTGVEVHVSREPFTADGREYPAGTIEERIQALKGEKKQLFNQVVGGHSGDFEWTKHFSSLHSLIQLSALEAAEPEQPYGPAAPAEVPTAGAQG